MATMTTSTSAVLNDLIEINNDRVAGFEKAMSDIKDENVDLKAVFQRFSTQSREFSQALTAVVARIGDEPETDTSMAGKLHRAWIDVKSLFGGSDRHSILAEAERGEDAIKKAYEKALQEGELHPEAATLVREQATKIRAAHDEIKALRDASE